MFEIIVSFWSVCVCVFSMRLVKVVMEFLDSRCENVMEVVCVIFFRFVGCDSVFLEYSRIDVFASLELLLTFWVHSAYFRLVNLFRLQSFILLNVCRNYFSFKAWRFHG